MPGDHGRRSGSGRGPRELLAAVLTTCAVVGLAGCAGAGPARPGVAADDGAVRAAPCHGRVFPDRVGDLPAGASTTGLGRQPAPYELQAPASRPRGVVIVLHGGGWDNVGPAQLRITRPEAARWLARGWATANLDYRPCARSVEDVLTMHDAVRRVIGPRTPMVVVGESAGAQLGLMLAALRPDSVGAVAAKAPPTDPVRLARQSAADPATGDPGRPAGRELAASWRGVFGARWLELSPVRRAGDIRARVLAARSHGDRLIPPGQVTDLTAALRAAHPHGWVRGLDLPLGDVRFAHAGISPAAERTLDAAERALVRPWTGPGAARPSVPVTVPGWWDFAVSRGDAAARP